jgi:hypothetical protein
VDKIERKKETTKKGKAYLLGAKLLPLTGNLVLGNWRIHEFDVRGKGYVLFLLFI